MRVPDRSPGADVAREALRGRPELIASRLLGAFLATESEAGIVTVRITEVEAYGGARDAGSHAFRGPTARNEVMFGDSGYLYVYFTYGMHWCANIVCAPVGEAGAVLVRAGEVIEGATIASSRRRTARRAVDLARGPANLASALGLTGDDGGADLLDDASRVRLRLPSRRPPARLVATGPRVGLRLAADLPWRFWLADDPTVSVFRPAAPRRARG